MPANDAPTKPTLLLTDTDDRLPRLALRPRDCALALGICGRVSGSPLEEYLAKQAKGGDAR